jgi:hypothetical protein
MAVSCRICKGTVSVAARIEERIGRDGVHDFYGEGLPQPLTEARGPLEAIYHPRCYFAAYKRLERGTHYEDSASASEMAASGEKVGNITKMSGHPEERERLKAERAGRSPYPHEHMGTVQDQAIIPHLQYAHGEPMEVIAGRTFIELQLVHRALHAQMIQESIRARRRVDLTDDAPDQSNWRDTDSVVI